MRTTPFRACANVHVCGMGGVVVVAGLFGSC